MLNVQNWWWGSTHFFQYLNISKCLLSKNEDQRFLRIAPISSPNDFIFGTLSQPPFFKRSRSALIFPIKKHYSSHSFRSKYHTDWETLLVLIMSMGSFNSQQLLITTKMSQQITRPSFIIIIIIQISTDGLKKIIIIIINDAIYLTKRFSCKRNLKVRWRKMWFIDPKFQKPEYFSSPK